MRTINFDPQKLTDAPVIAAWKALRNRAETATDRVLKRWEDWCQLPAAQRPDFDPKLDQKIWSDLKVWLNQNVFGRRCAYCESTLELDRFEGDAEHFRPKGRITFRDAAGKRQVARCKLSDGDEMDHPGYFWLAYDWRNLMPACAACNSASKVDQFPIRATHVFHSDEQSAGFAPGYLPARHEGVATIPNARTFFLPPARLDALESPLLLNPLNPTEDCRPSKHLRYGLGGLVVALDDSELGKTSIEVYQLKREVLRKRRQAAQEFLQLDYYSVMQRNGAAAVAAAEGVLAPYKSGQKEYSSAALQALDELEAMAQRMRAAP